MKQDDIRKAIYELKEIVRIMELQPICKDNPTVIYNTNRLKNQLISVIKLLEPSIDESSIDQEEESVERQPDCVRETKPIKVELYVPKKTSSKLNLNEFSKKVLCHRCHILNLSEKEIDDKIITTMCKDLKLSETDEEYADMLYNGLTSLINLIYTFKDVVSKFIDNVNKIDEIMYDHYFWTNIKNVVDLIQFSYKYDHYRYKDESAVTIVSVSAADARIYDIYEYIRNAVISNRYESITSNSIRSLYEDDCSLDDVDFCLDYIMNSNLNISYKLKMIYILISLMDEYEIRHLTSQLDSYTDEYCKQLIKTVLDNMFTDYGEYCEKSWF